MIFSTLKIREGLRNDYEIANLRTRRDEFALLSNIIRLSQMHNASHWRAFAACAVILLRKKRLSSRISCGRSGDNTPFSRCMRTGQGLAGEERADGFGSDAMHCHSSPPRSPTLRRRQKKHGRAWSSPTSMGWMKREPCDGQLLISAVRKRLWCGALPQRCSHRSWHSSCGSTRGCQRSHLPRKPRGPCWANRGQNR